VLRTAWKTAPHPDLAAQALVAVSEPSMRLREAARLVAQNPGHPESHFLLARLAQEAKLPEQALVHAEAARDAGMNQQRLWLLLADLAVELEGDSEVGRLAQRDALRHAALSQGDPGWRCDACGTAHTGWMPACPACHTAGRISWGIAERPRMLGTTAG
jgi:HemY protein